MNIRSVHAREILDSRGGTPTIEVDVALESGARGRAAVPSGASTGSSRGAGASRQGPQTVRRERRPEGRGARKRRDRPGARGPERRSARARRRLIALDGTPTKSRLGANALLGVSMAALARAAASQEGSALSTHRRCSYGSTAFTLPVPMMNILNGGAHADSSVDFQEFMVMPLGAPIVRRSAAHGRRSLPRAARHPEEARPVDGRRRRGRVRAEPQVEPRSGRGRARGRSTQGRVQARARRLLALDVASSELWAGDGRYTFKKSGEPDRTSDEMIGLYEDWMRQYPIVSIEDGLAEGDWDGWKRADDGARQTASSWSATTCSSRTRRS